jgi:hypothetical protein
MQDGKTPACIGPMLLQCKTGFRGGSSKAIHGVFVGMLSTDHFVPSKIERCASDRHDLVDETLKKYFDSAMCCVVECSVSKAFELKVAFQFVINAPQEIQIELGRDSLGIVISTFERCSILLQVDTDQEPTASTAKRRDSRQ